MRFLEVIFEASFWIFFFAVFTVFSTLESSKIVLPSRRELNFYKIEFFELDAKRHRKQIKKGMDFDVNLGLEAC